MLSAYTYEIVDLQKVYEQQEPQPVQLLQLVFLEPAHRETFFIRVGQSSDAYQRDKYAAWNDDLAHEVPREVRAEGALRLICDGAS